MQRSERQAARRQSLLEAAGKAASRHGAARLRLKDVADAAGVTPASILYHFENGIDAVLSELYREMTGRFCEKRRAIVDAIDEPADQLAAAIREGVPKGPDDNEAVLLWQMDAFVGSGPLYDVLGTQSFEEQASVYERICAVGEARGDFKLAAHPRDVGRVLVALEDGLGRQVIGINSGLDREKALRIISEVASLLVGAHVELQDSCLEAD